MAKSPLLERIEIELTEEYDKHIANKVITIIEEDQVLSIPEYKSLLLLLIVYTHYLVG